MVWASSLAVKPPDFTCDAHPVSPTDTAIPVALLQSYPAMKMTAYKVSTRMGSPKNVVIATKAGSVSE